MPRKHFIWDPVTSAYLMEQDGHGDTTAVYHTEPVPYGRLISQRRGGQTSYYQQDALGSTVQLTDEDENVTDEYTYSAYGETVAQSGTTDNPFRWIGDVGYYFDAETGEYYVRTRYYVPANERWTNTDPLLFADGPNFYAAYFIPFERDPSGMDIRPAASPRPIPTRRNATIAMASVPQSMELMWPSQAAYLHYVLPKNAPICATSCADSAPQHALSVG